MPFQSWIKIQLGSVFYILLLFHTNKWRWTDSKSVYFHIDSWHSSHLKETHSSLLFPFIITLVYECFDCVYGCVPLACLVHTNTVEGTNAPGSRFTDGYEPSRVHWEWNPKHLVSTSAFCWATSLTKRPLFQHLDCRNDSVNINFRTYTWTYCFEWAEIHFINFIQLINTHFMKISISYFPFH